MIFRQGHERESRWVIWKIEETKEELLSMLADMPLLANILEMKSETKMLERLAVRVLLKQMAGKEQQIHYHGTGKPYMGTEGMNISISHTRGYVAVALSPLRYVGIDIQSITEKVKNVRRRFISDKEYINPRKEVPHLMLHWSAKESVYKALGIPAVNFSRQLIVEPFEVGEKGVFNVTEKVTERDNTFAVNYFFCKDFLFTYLIQ